MRDHEYPLEKPIGVARIAVLGDSYAFGNGVPAEATFAKVLERALNAKRESDVRFEVMNFGVKGYDTTQELATLREVALRLDPDVILVAYFLNDVGDPERSFADDGGDLDRGGGTDGDAPEGEGGATAPRGPRQVPIRMRVRDFLVGRSRLGAFLVREIAIAVRAVVRVPYQGVVDYNRPFVENGAAWRTSKSALGEIKAIADSITAPMMVVIIPEMGNFNEQYPFHAAHDSLAAYCSAIGVPTCDLLDGFTGLEAKRLWVAPDDPHFNRRAHRLAAGQIEGALAARGLLPAAQGPR
jgi:lysophospholipase L1-like esterase